ncbi:zinc ribbon domain-containing protein [Halobacteriaceae archaeon GCM10025711]
MSGHGLLDPAVEREHAVTAVLLSVLAPGLGHLYLRAWLRALAWGTVTVALAVGLLPEPMVSAVTTGSSQAVVDALRSGAGWAPVVLAALMVRLVGAFDAWLTVRRRSHGDLRARCPACSRPLDEDLEFCANCLYEPDE